MMKHPSRRDRPFYRSPQLVSVGAWTRVVLVGLFLALVACGSSDANFSPCVASPDCSGGRQCFTLSSGAGVCLDTCPAEQALCAAGEACVPPNAADTDWVCLPGGNVAIGGACSRSVDCDLGGVCVTDGSITVCRRACDPRAPICAAGTMCSAWNDTRGYCAQIPVVPDMGTTPADGG